MNLKSVFLSGLLVTGVLCGTADAAVAVKKAAAVATKETGKMDSATSLVGNVIGLVTTVQSLKTQQKALEDDCVPSSSEISFVDKIVKEWAMTGAVAASDIKVNGAQPCVNSYNSYRVSAERAENTEMDNVVCYDTFTGVGNDGMVWAGYPKVGVAEFCPGGDVTCKTKKKVSNIYDIFNLVDFNREDYTAQELTMATKLMDKIERCSNSKLNAKKRALWGEFLTGTLSNVGQKTNTGTILQQVTSVSNSGGLGALGSLGGMAAQFLDR